jgi:hypothetical protein
MQVRPAAVAALEVEVGRRLLAFVQPPALKPPTLAGVEISAGKFGKDEFADTALPLARWSVLPEA